MGTQKTTSCTRCRHAGCFASGVAFASLVTAAMFGILWFCFGLTIVQISDSQRRAIVNYSYTTTKPPTTSSSSNRTEVYGDIESSLNAISKSPVTPPSQPRRRGGSSADLAKGDFAARSQVGNSTRRESIVPVTSSSHERRASILSGGEDDGMHPRKVSTSNEENRAQEEGLPEIKPTQTYAPAQSDPLPTIPRDERKPITRNSDRRDEIEYSRPSYRDPDFDREPPPRRSEPGRRRYDDDDYDDRGSPSRYDKRDRGRDTDDDDYDDRGSPSRYDKRDRGRDTDDRYSKGDTRVYPDERPRSDDRYPLRDSDRRRGDDRDDRYRDRDDRYRDYDDRYKHRDDRYGYKEDPYRDDEKYRNDRPYLDEDRNRRRDRTEYDDKYLPEDDRYRYDDRYRSKDDRYRNDDDRYRDRPIDDRRDRYIPKDDEDRYTRSRERDSRDSIISSRVDLPSDRKSGRPEDSRRPSDYDVPIRDRPRTSYSDESKTDDRYVNRDDEYRRPSKYDDPDRIYPSRTRDESYISRSTVPISRSRDDSYKLGPSVIDERMINDDRYSSNRDRSKYPIDDNRRVEESRYISPSSVREIDGTRREVNNDDYRTRLPEDKKADDIGLERRSYSAEEEEYRRQNSRTRYYDDADRKPPGDSRREYRTDDDYPRRTRTDDDEYRRIRPRGDYDTDRSRVSDTYDRPIDDRPSKRYSDEYDEPRRRSDADIGLRKDSYPRDEDRTSRRKEERRPLPPAKDRRYDDDIPPRRPISDVRPYRSRSDTIDDRPLRPAVERASEDGRRYRDDTYLEDDRRYKDDVSVKPDDTSRYVPPRSERREPFGSSPTSPLGSAVREKRYQNSGKNFDDRGNEEERPINTKDIIDAALKHSDAPNQNPRKVSYPVFDPRVSNLTLSDFIPPSDRRGTTIMSRKKRRVRTY